MAPPGRIETCSTLHFLGDCQMYQKYLKVSEDTVEQLFRLVNAEALETINELRYYISTISREAHKLNAKYGFELPHDVSDFLEGI